MSPRTVRNNIPWCISPVARVLNSYLWEIIAYAEENSKLAPVYHGWFNFPKSLYHQLFKERNGIDFSTYEDHLVNWKDPERQFIDFAKLRTIKTTKALQFKSMNDSFYPLANNTGLLQGINIPKWRLMILQQQ